MIQRVRAWLPNGAFEVATGERALGGTVAAWSHHWFSRGEAVVSACRQDLPAPRDSLSADGVAGAIALPPRARRTLLEAALALDLAEMTIGEPDRPVLDRLAEQMTHDLLKRLAMSRGEGEDSAMLGVTLALGGRELLTLHLPMADVARLIQAALPRRTQREPLTSRRKALGPTSITVDGLLGYGMLSISELEGLSAGDIVLLDRGSSAKAELRLAPGSRLIAPATMGRSGDHPSLRL